MSHPFNTEVTGWVIGMTAALVTIAWTLWQWRKRLDAELIAREDDRRLLKRIDRELHTNGGSSAVDRIENGVRRNADAIHRLSGALSEMERRNEEAHNHLTRRIDGIHQMIVGNTSPTQSMQERHHKSREDD